MLPGVLPQPQSRKQEVEVCELQEELEACAKQVDLLRELILEALVHRVGNDCVVAASECVHQ